MHTRGLDAVGAFMLVVSKSTDDGWGGVAGCREYRLGRGSSCVSSVRVSAEWCFVSILDTTAPTWQSALLRSS